METGRLVSILKLIQSNQKTSLLKQKNNSLSKLISSCWMVDDKTPNLATQKCDFGPIQT